MSNGRHHERLDDTPPPMPSERATGLIFATLSMIAALLLRHFPATMWTLAASSIGFLTLTLAWPGALAPLSRAWFRLALLLNRFISPVVMFAIYATAKFHPVSSCRGCAIPCCPKDAVTGKATGSSARQTQDRRLPACATNFETAPRRE